jgi:hypothetical protein
MACLVCGNAPNLSKGKVTVWNEVDDGTEVELCVPRSEGLCNRSKGFVVAKKARRRAKGMKS